MEKSREILKKIWGFDTFRSIQESIVDDAIYGHDVLALLPTGGGKSICFQVPGMAREGLTLVISPLIALMEDQVNNLVSKGLRAKSIVSGMSYREIDITLDNARFGALDFLYTSPERLQSSLFIERFKLMNIGLIVIDEAHCISEWGHDFRPSFKSIYELRTIHPSVPFIALTATATERVQKDIIKELRLNNPKIHEASFERSNLSYEAYISENKQQKIIDYCQNHLSECGIVYCQTRKSVKAIARLLHANNISVGVYHGGMTKEDRSLMLNNWLQNKISVMVATNAFGMGIDKPDVRFVLHYEFPPSLEAYFQEAGRAGRDGQESRAIVFWEEKDCHDLITRTNQAFPSIEIVKNTYKALCNHLKIAIGSGKDETYFFEIVKFCTQFNLKPIETYNALKILGLNNDLVFSEGVFHPTKVKLAIGNKELYNFQIQHASFLNLITLMTRSYPGIFDSYFELHTLEFCKRLALTKPELENLLKQLEKYGVIDVSWQSNLPSVTLTHERLPDDYLNLSNEVYLDRKNNAEKKLNAAISFLKTTSCRAKFVVNYFGQKGNDCGKCDNCIKKDQSTISIVDETTKLLEFLKTPQSYSNCLISTKLSETNLKELLQKLELAEKISFDGTNFHLNQH
jgi:ATP-dependent DNA helicase RecQ